jgi:hypothetical protein
MNKNTYLTAGLYFGTFSVAYAGFFYQKIEAQHSPMSITDVSTAQSTKQVYTQASIHTDNNNRRQSLDVSSDNGHVYTAELEQTDEKPYKESHNRKHSNRIGRLSSTTQSSSSIEDPDDDYPYQASYRSESYVSDTGDGSQYVRQKDVSTTPDTINLSAYTVTTEQAVSVRSPATQAVSTSYESTVTSSLTTSTTTTSSSGSRSTAYNSSIQSTYLPEGLVSDGAEFLPDGSSQEDLYRTKDPKVYTIESYKVADISCAPGYGKPSPHAALIYQLKGC